MFIRHIFNNKNYFKIFHCKFQTKNKSDINGLISNYLYILWWIIHTYFDIFIPCWLHLATFFTYQFVNHVIIIQMQASLKSVFADMNCRNDFYFTYPVLINKLNWGVEILLENSYKNLIHCHWCSSSVSQNFFFVKAQTVIPPNSPPPPDHTLPPQSSLFLPTPMTCFMEETCNFWR
jgi:hypothetical protein